MSKSRDRMIKAFEFNSPDKIPVYYHPSQAGLYVHGKKLLDLFNEYPPDNPVIFDSVPEPPSYAFDENGKYHEIKKDLWGTEWEYMVFGITGYAKKYPFQNWKEACSYEFPSIPLINSDLFNERKEIITKQKENFFIFSGWISIFEKLNALRPMDEVLIDIITKNPDLMSFIDRLTSYWLKEIEYQLAVDTDVIIFGDDWGMQSSPFVSLELFREVFRPCYESLMKPIKDAGKKVFLHSCGCLDNILDEFMEIGIDGLWPQITCYNENIFLKQCIDHKVTVYIQPDRQRLIPMGSPSEIEETIRKYAERYHNLNGGGVFYIEIENDAPFENIEALIKSVHKYR